MQRTGVVVHRDAAPVVEHPEHVVGRLLAQLDPDRVRTGVLDHVRQRLAHDA